MTHRIAIENEIGAIVAQLQKLPFTRVISLKREFGSVLTRIMNSPAGTIVTFDMTAEHWPFFLRGRTFSVKEAHLAVVLREGAAISQVALAFDNRFISEWETPSAAAGIENPSIAGLPHADVSAELKSPVAEHRFMLTTVTPLQTIEDLLLFCVLE